MTTGSPKRVYKCDKLTMRVLEEYPSGFQAARTNGLDKYRVCQAAGKRCVSAGSFVWRYADDYDPSESFEGKPNRPIAVLDTKLHELSVFPGIKDAARELGVTEKAISSAMCHKHAVLDRYVFKYAR